MDNLKRSFKYIKSNRPFQVVKNFFNYFSRKPLSRGLEQKDKKAMSLKILGKENISMHPSCILEEGVCLDARDGTIVIGESCTIGHHARIQSSGNGVVINNSTMLGHDVLIDASMGYIEIAERCLIGANVVIKGSGKGVSIKPECIIGDNVHVDSLGGQVHLGSKTTIGFNGVIVGTGHGVHIKGNCDFEYGVTLDSQGGSIHIDEYSGSGPYTIIYGHGKIEIGRYCAIAGQTMFIPGNHRFDRTDIPIRKQGIRSVGINVGDDVWIGAQCVILDGAKIGTGCVIGAGSIVRGEFPDYSVAVGAPCQVIKNRKANN